MTGVEAAPILHRQQMLGPEVLTTRRVLTKINSVLIPGINDEHLIVVNRAVKKRGAFLHNIMPLVSEAEHGTHFNPLRAQLAGTDFAAAQGFQLNGLKREELIATNSRLLHGPYFTNLGGDGSAMLPAMQPAFDASVGSLARWCAEFSAMGKALGGGSGWVLRVFQPHEGTLGEPWAADHTHALAGGVPILALDMVEHAHHMDFGAAAGGLCRCLHGTDPLCAGPPALPGRRGRRQRALHRRPRRCPGCAVAGHAPCRRLRRGGGDAARCPVARSGGRGRLAHRPATRSRACCLLRRRP